MYKDIFTSLGLSVNESIIYEHLLKSGETTAGEIIKKAPLKRGVIYNVLEDLKTKGLISEKKIIPKGGKGKTKVSHFAPNHPERLREFLEEEKNKLKKAESTLQANLPSIISDFNLISGKPGVRFFEGIEGVKKVIADTLINNTKKELATFSDVASYMKYLKSWNMNFYAPKRREASIFERVIIPDNPKAVDYMKEYTKNPESDKLTEILFIDHKSYPFETEINIYENKVSFVTFSEKSHIGLIIENKEIFNSLSSSFNLIWSTLKK
jgi:HTH-type transcriptional regulator, sugar sensing transcriptional regulator